MNRSRGKKNSAPIQGLLRRLDNILCVRDHGILERLAIRNRHIERSHPFNGGIEIIKCLLLDLRGNLRSDAAPAASLMDDDGAIRIANRFEDGVKIPGNERSQVD